MVTTRRSGSGSDGPVRRGLDKDEIRLLITTQVTFAVRQVILKVFRYIKTTMIEIFDERYVVVTEVVSAACIASITAIGLHGV